MLCVVLLLACATAAGYASHAVHDLPGLYTPAANFSAGYLKVDSPVGRLAVFHCHVQHSNPAAPLIVWMNGGPGASSLMGFMTELGPYLFNLRSKPKSVGGNWTAFANPSSWSGLGSLLVWEQPAGVGFSRCLGGCPTQWNDATSATANLHVLRAFYTQYPSEAQRRLVITGESYGGIYVPLLAQLALHDAVLGAAGVRLSAIAVGDGCIGFSVSGGCGSDSLDIFISTLERLAPGVQRSALSAVRSGCTAAELTTGRQPGQLSKPCAAAVKALFEEVGEYNEYHCTDARPQSGDVLWPPPQSARASAAPAFRDPIPVLTVESTSAQGPVRAAPTARATGATARRSRVQRTCCLPTFRSRRPSARCTSSAAASRRLSGRNGTATHQTTT